MILVPLLAGLWLLYTELPPIWEGWKSGTWPSVEGRVVDTSVRPVRRPKTRYDVYVLTPRYSYEVNGKREGSRIRMFDPWFSTREEAENAAKELRARRPLRVFYNAGNPDRSLLEPGIPYGSVLFAVVGVALCGVGIWAKFWVDGRLNPAP